MSWQPGPQNSGNWPGGPQPQPGQPQPGSQPQQQPAHPVRGGYPQSQPGQPRPGGYPQQQQAFPAPGGYPQPQPGGYPQPGLASGPGQVPPYPGYQEQAFGHRQQPGYPALPGKQPPKSRMPLVLGIVAVSMVIALVVAFLVLRPSLGGKGSDQTFQPSGPQSVWLDSRYSGGITSWPLDGHPLGISQDRNVLLAALSVGVAGLDVVTGQELWRLDDVFCERNDAVLDGFAYCARMVSGGTDLIRIDVATGETQVFYEAPFFVTALRPVAVYNDAFIVQAYDSAGIIILMFPGDGDITWQRVYPASAACQLIGDHIACKGFNSFAVLDAATGEPTVDVTALPEGGGVYWMLDGYYIAPAGIPMPDVPLQTYDLNGNPLPEIVNPRPPLWPSDWEGFLYSSDDLRQEGFVTAVDAQGKVVVDHAKSGFGEFTLQPAGVTVPGSLVAGVSQDGNLVLIQVVNDALVLYDREGNELHDFGAASRFRTVDGLIVEGYADQVVIHAPAG